MSQLKASDLVESPAVEPASIELTGGGLSQIIADVKEILKLIAQVRGQGVAFGFPRSNYEKSSESGMQIPRQLPPPPPVPSLTEQLRPLLDTAMKMGLGDMRLGEAIDAVPFTLNQLKEMLK